MAISEDDTFGVLSAASDSESHWDDNASNEDYGYQSTASFRMPAMDGVATRNTCAPKGTFENLRLPSSRQLPSQDLEVILFAPMLAARTISAALRAKSKAAKASVSVLYFNGTGLFSLDTNNEFEDTVSTLRHRIGILYYPSTETFDPCPEYDLFVAKYHRIPCIALSDRLLDPFCLNASSIVTTSVRHLMQVTTFDGRSARIPIAMDYLHDMSLAALVPTVKDGIEPVAITQFNRSSWSSWITTLAAAFTLLSTVSLFILHLSSSSPAVYLGPALPLNTAATSALAYPSTALVHTATSTPSTTALAHYDVLGFAYSGINHAVDGAVMVAEHGLGGLSRLIDYTHSLIRSIVDATNLVLLKIRRGSEASSAFVKQKYRTGCRRWTAQQRAANSATSKAYHRARNTIGGHASTSSKFAKHSWASTGNALRARRSAVANRLAKFGRSWRKAPPTPEKKYFFKWR